MKSDKEALSILHAGFIVEPSGGVLQQLEYEQSLASRGAVPWTAILFSRMKKNSPVSIGANRYLCANKFLTRLNYYFWLRRSIIDVDVLLLRYSLADPLQWLFLLVLNKPVYLVHHTIEEHQFQALPGVTGMIKKMLERLIGPSCLSLASGSIAVTHEIAQYEKARLRATGDYPILIYPNGVLIDQEKDWVEEKDSSRDGSQVQILFVSSLFTSWHGLDLLLDSIELSNRSFLLHVVGELYESEKSRCDADHRVVVHGSLGVSQMLELERKCVVGIGSLALYRKSLNEACTLKVRQYLCAGLPVYSGHSDVFPNDFPYYKVGEPNIDCVLEYVKKLNNVNRANVRELSAPYIDKKKLWSRLHSDIVRDCKKRWPGLGQEIDGIRRVSN